jgi:hypothetical protein
VSRQLLVADHRSQPAAGSWCPSSRQLQLLGRLRPEPVGTWGARREAKTRFAIGTMIHQPLWSVSRIRRMPTVMLGIHGQRI